MGNAPFEKVNKHIATKWKHGIFYGPVTLKSRYNMCSTQLDFKIYSQAKWKPDIGKNTHLSLSIIVFRR